MGEKRWWDAAVFGTLLVIAVVAFVGGSTSAARLGGGGAALIALALSYALIARPRLATTELSWRLPVFVAVTSLALCGAIIANPFLAVAQTVIYPLVWSLGADRRHGIVGSIVVALSSFVGFVIGGGFSSAAFGTALLSAGFSVVFAVVFGLWITSIAEHAEERGRLVAELTSAQEQVALLSRHKGVAQERERMAREIHDTLAQTLAGLVILAERAGRQSRDGEPEAAAQTIRTVEDAARVALEEARALVARTAAVPAEAALDASMERLVARFRAETGLPIELRVRGDTLRLDRETQVVLLRCVQEALANIRKHASAQHVDVEVAVGADGDVSLDVRDDGCGFDPGHPRTGFGLDGMVERLALAGGTARVASEPGGGTAVEVRLPAPVVSA